MSDFCHNCGELKQEEHGFYIKVGISLTELDQPSDVLMRIIDLHLDKIRQQFIHKIGLSDGTHERFGLPYEEFIERNKIW